MTSITAVTAESGDLASHLMVTTTVGTADFNVDVETAQQAQTLLLLLMAQALASPIVEALAPSERQSAGTDELINLKWRFNSADVDSLDFVEPARLLGI